MQKIYVTFLSLNKKVTKEVSLRGAKNQCATLGIPRPIAGTAQRNHILESDVFKYLPMVRYGRFLRGRLGLREQSFSAA